MNPTGETAAATPAPAAARPSLAVRAYFVAPPSARDLTLGRLFLLLGLAAIVGSFVLYILSVGLSASSPSTGSILLLVFAIFLVILGNLAGWPLLVFAVIRFHRYQRQRGARSGAASDQQMDYWFNQDMNAIEQRAWQEMGIPRELVTRRPLTVVGPALPTDYAMGLDGKPRYASYEVAVVLLTELQVCAYSCVLNMVTGLRELETTHEFMLTDVTSIGTMNDRLAAHGGAASPGNLIRMAGPIAMSYLTPADVSVRQEFRITLTSGDALAVNVGCHVNGTTLSDERLRHYVRGTVQALRATLREIKRPRD
ncbi:MULTISPECIES: hypothetical protein [Actinomadura]|uniref:hypothetical protein n=1 Tax=Actinomadura TaxID=1988 RepID=UPI0015646F17|nr:MULTISPECIES: hypothetical protein [Actinomadura]MBT2211098.1 hypothetical protein [Actinomadura sp. NEAU-AAG7]